MQIKMASRGRGGKPPRDSRQKKEEVADKVKEIKLRQQNWMKQREEQKNNEPQAGNVKSIPTTTTQSNSAGSRIDAQSNNTRQQKPSTQPTQLNPRGKFKNWLQNRDTQSSHGNKWTENETDSRSMGTVNKRGSSAPVILKKNTLPPDYHFLNEHSASDEETTEGIRSRLLAPKDFDALADRIVTRVRGDMGYKGGYDEYKERGVFEQSETNILRTDTDSSSLNMQSHQCACCGEIMLDSLHTPMLLIPCGHTVCRTCCKGRELCPDCYCSIGSTTCNIMLQQIIQEYQGKRVVTGANSRTYRKDEHYTPDNYQERKSSSSAHHSHQAEYREQLQNLQTRLSILSTEKSSANHDCERLSEEIQREAHQMRNISKQEDNICSQIEALEEKLTLLRQHKSEYEDRLGGLKSEREEAQQRLSMLKDTMYTLSNEMEKVKLLAEA